MPIIACIGDSLVEGEGDETGLSGWPTRLAQKLPAYRGTGTAVEGYTIHNLGIGGDTIRDIDSRLGEALIREPHLLIIGCCNNDIARYPEADGLHPKMTAFFRQHFWNRVLRKAKNMCPRVLVTPGVFIAEDKMADYGCVISREAFEAHVAFIVGACAQHGVEFCGVPRDFAREDWRSHGVHWNGKGYDALAGLYFDKLKQLGWV